MPSHYLNQCWNVVNWPLRNKLQWNLNQNSYIAIGENAFENGVCKMASIMSRPQCVKEVWGGVCLQWGPDMHWWGHEPQVLGRSYCRDLTHWCRDNIVTISQTFSIFLNENVWISLKISLKFVPEVRINSLAPGKFEWNFRCVIFKQILVINGWGISCEIALIWMSLDLTDDQSTLVEVMAWCPQTTSHYLSQCRPRSLSPYGVTRPEWVNNIPALVQIIT